MKKLYLDDIRIPKTEGWDIVRTYEEFVDWIKKNGLPSEVSFDHDLAEIHYDPSTWTENFKYHEKTGYDAAKWMCGYCMENGLPLPEFNCHSANLVGRENILAILNSHKERLNY
jgi:hypothetical protein